MAPRRSAASEGGSPGAKRAGFPVFVVLVSLAIGVPKSVVLVNNMGVLRRPAGPVKRT
jgi:hypothetical protein